MQENTEEEEKPKKWPNDLIRHLKNWEHVEKVFIDLDSPNFRTACENLGIDPKECKKKNLKHFKEKGVEEDVI